MGKNANDLKTPLATIMSTVALWFRYNRLSLNCSKTQFMVFGTRHECAQVTFHHIIHEDNKILRADKLKYLGMQLDPLLNFEEHVEYIKRKMIGKVKLLCRLNEILSKDTLLMLDKTLILPIIDHGDVIFDCINQKNVMILQRVQNMALKSILKVPCLTPTVTIHNDLNMLTLSNRRQLHVAK